MSKLPIRKVVVGFVAGGLVWLAGQLGLLDHTVLGLSLDSEAVKSAAPWLVFAAVSYLVRDPRVRDLLDDTDLVDDELDGE